VPGRSAPTSARVSRSLVGHAEPPDEGETGVPRSTGRVANAASSSPNQRGGSLTKIDDRVRLLPIRRGSSAACASSIRSRK
jgi:hypothetical protein